MKITANWETQAAVASSAAVHSPLPAEGIDTHKVGVDQTGIFRSVRRQAHST